MYVDCVDGFVIFIRAYSIMFAFVACQVPTQKCITHVKEAVFIFKIIKANNCSLI